MKLSDVNSFQNLLFGPSAAQRKSNGVLSYDVVVDVKTMDFQRNAANLYLLKFTGVKVFIRRL